MENHADKLKEQLREWENELYEISREAQEEVTQAGKTVQKRYDRQINTLENKAEKAKRKLRDL